MTSPWAHLNFRWLVIGASVNTLGNGVAPVALAFAVLDLGGDAAQLGLVVALYALANVVTVLAGGVLGDRFSRRTVMVAGSAAEAVVQSFVAASLIFGWASIPLLGVTGVLLGGLGAIGQPSAQAITQQTVPPALLGPAISWRRLAQNAGVIVGSGVAGLMVAAFGSGWAIAVDAATFVVAAVAYRMIRVAPVTAADGAESTQVLAEVASGFREVARHTWLWLLIGQALLYHLFYGGAQSVLGPIVVGDELGRPAWGYALSVMMVGFVVGGLLTLRWRPRHALGVGTCFLALTACFPWAMALSDQLWIVLAGAFVHGFGLEIFSVGWDLSIQENVAPDKLSRVYSFDQIGSFVARPIGLALTGPIAEVVGMRTWLLVVGAVMALSVVAALGSRDVRTLTRAAPVLTPTSSAPRAG